MSQLDDMIAAIEQTEADNEMYFSLYSVPTYYNEEESPE